MRDFHVHYTGSLPLPYIYERFAAYTDKSSLPSDFRKVTSYDEFRQKILNYFGADHVQNRDKFFEIYSLFQLLTKPQQPSEFFSSYTTGCFEICKNFAAHNLTAFDIIAGPCPTIDLTNARLSAMIEGIEKAKKTLQHKLDVRIRLTFIRNQSGKIKNFSNALLDDIFLLLKDPYFASKIAGFDISGEERPLKDFFDENCDILEKINEKNKAYNTHYETGIHAGENVSGLPEDEEYFYLFERLKNLAVTRICHGTFWWLNQDVRKEKLLQEFAKKNTIFDICPTANLYLTPLTSIDKIPLDYFKNINLKYTLNRDNPSIFNNLQHA